MSLPQSHPRRRPIKASTPPLSTHGMSLRKGNTFSSPKCVTSDLFNLENQRYMPRRSPTSTESLEELIHDANGSRAERISRFLDNIDTAMTDSTSTSTSGADILNDREVLPVPRFMLDNARLESTHMEIDSDVAQQLPSHDHASDSGLGSSIDSKYSRSRAPPSQSEYSHMHAINSSFSAAGAQEEKHTLSEYASSLIRKSIVDPILAEESLKDFHPLIKDVPRRIGEKNICNLRDLEKTLIFLAPQLSATSESYRLFCERTIQLLQVTVERLPESDQKLPSDRPYTSNYFLDLIEQIRRYAQIMATTRRKEENGEDLNEMDYSRDEKIVLHGGLSRNGRPLELVREKNRKVLPIVDRVEDAHAGFSNKRALSDDEMDSDEATRSMARRRKSEKPGDVMHLCRDCKKEFKRPCDLTKHEKTHSRPWKCTEQNCKYFELGWPTEKERDRHVNDKHSSAPAQYKCLYPPCTYASKRESNCKQHMEKAHGWEYVRSKSNGRKKAQASGSDRAPPTPLTPFLSTPQSAALSTPITPFIPSPSVPILDNFEYPYGIGTPAMMAPDLQDDFRRDSVTTDGSNFTYSSGHSPVEQTSFDDAVTPEDTTINHNDVFGNCGLATNFNNAFQPPTPAMSTGYNFDPLQFQMTSAPSHLPHLSPSGQADMTLFSPPMPADEGFGDMDMDMDMGFSRPTGDFTLFQNPTPNELSLANTNFFPEITQFGGQFDSNLYVEPTTKLDDLMGFDFN